MNGDMQRWTPNVASIIEHAKEFHPNKEVISRMVSGDIHRTNYDEVCIRSRKLASALERDGYKKGDVIATLALNTYRHLEMYYGISGMGAICHTLNFRLHPEQAVYIINHADDKIIFCEVPFIPILEGLKDQLPCVEKYIILCDASDMPETALKNAISYEEYISSGDEDYEWPAMDDDAACGLCYTSGTTGNPKGVLYSHKSNILHAQASLVGMPIGPDESILMVVPLFHVLAWGIPYYGPMHGSKLVMPGMQMEGEPLYDLIEKEKVTLAFGVPTIWMGLLAYCRDNNKILTSVKNTIIGGSALSLPTLQEFDEVHDVNVIHAWGMTEMSPLGTINVPTSEMENMSKEEKYAIQLKQGKPIYGVELKVVDDAGIELPKDGESQGHLMVRGPWILQKYFKAEKDAVDKDGWFDTGDISVLDTDGYMIIKDRAKDVIKSGGEWISSIDLENAAFGHPDIAEACVVGIPHPKWDERPMLFVVTNSGAPIEKDGILEFLTSKVAKWWLPDEIIFLKELPHGATGKLQKFELREEYNNYYMEK
ncbi:MAG: long-chain fatty acid--CoA ligase [Gammaproteobacteria bacterium]|uniref:Long-chain fatty acid--CoA ligase n=1 Tax=SAR86 cluster bacterium TaxID=2030880 RepID=A0A368C4M9_9GAMM|nr:MAG: long-chain fatty acid--CoA ligase [SAR86 cluster bacterium]